MSFGFPTGTSQSNTKSTLLDHATQKSLLSHVKISPQTCIETSLRTTRHATNKDPSGSPIDKPKPRDPFRKKPSPAWNASHNHRSVLLCHTNNTAYDRKPPDCGSLAMFLLKSTALQYFTTIQHKCTEYYNVLDKITNNTNVRLERLFLSHNCNVAPNNQLTVILQ